MKTFTNKDIEDYYNHSEVHYKMFWKLEESMGLHYGIWDEGVKTIAESVLNTNKRLMQLAAFSPETRILDAGCGIGGSSIFMARNSGCKVTGITLSARQVKTATAKAEQHGVLKLVNFEQKDYTATGYPDNTFDIVWAIESMQTARDKSLFYKEISRILKPGGRLLIADIFKPRPYDMAPERDMQTMINGWAMTDILSLQELDEIAGDFKFKIDKLEDVTKEVKKSVDKIYLASVIGKLGTKIYNLFYNATYFSRIHYTTGLAQYKTYKEGKWGYYLVALVNVK